MCFKIENLKIVIYFKIYLKKEFKILKINKINLNNLAKVWNYADTLKSTVLSWLDFKVSAF